MRATDWRSWPATPTIVAEALVAVVDPLALWLRPGPAGTPASVASAIARSAVAPAATDPAPDWLRPEQRVAFATLLPIIRRHRGALLADAPGTGKTFTALAVAGVYPRGTVTVLVPATLRRQWTARAATLGVALEIVSHEEVSRGRRPARSARLVIVDESHRFRNPGTRRYQTLAPWMMGRDALLLTATPIVNDPEDLAHQLLLAVRSDALAPLGVPSLLATLARGHGHSALGELVVARQPRDGAIPSSTHQVIRWSDDGTIPAWARAVEALALSPTRGVAELIRGVLWAAAASSVAALAGCVRRYAALLDHAADARATGRDLTREELRTFTGPMGGQLAMWELIAPSGGSTDLDLNDRERLPALRALLEQELASVDAKLHRLRAVLADGAPTIVFTGSVDTVRYLRTELAGAAWCTGASAGIGHLHADREVVLAAFAPGGMGPDVLIATDIAAEGLDLHRASRVVHFDLPWTPMRLRQREGRVARIGAGRSSVGVVWFRPPEWLDRKERRALRVRQKARAVVRAGFHQRAPELWRWRHELAAGAGHPAPFGCSAAVRGTRAELLVAFELQGGSERLGSLLGVVNKAGEWIDDPGVVADAVARASNAEAVEVGPDTWDAWLERALPHARAAVRRANDISWSWSELRPEARMLVRRLRREAALAARRRDARELALLDRGLAFATRGHTAGELTLVMEMAEASRPGLLLALSRLPEQARERGPTSLRVAGMVLFVAEEPGADS